MTDRDQFIDIASDYLANPYDARKPQDIADELHLSLSQYYRVKKQLKDEINQAADRKRSKYYSEIRSAAYKSLVKRFDRSDRAIELALKVMGDLVERSEVKTEFMTVEQKVEKAKELFEKLSARLSVPKSDGSK